MTSLARAVLGAALFLAGCQGPSGGGETKSGRFVISDVQMNKTRSGTYEVTYDATWEGDLGVHKSPCDIWLMGPDDVRLGEAKTWIKESGMRLTTTVKKVEGVPERAEVDCATTSMIP
jgi:hypothetical protein